MQFVLFFNCRVNSVPFDDVSFFLTVRNTPPTYPCLPPPPNRTQQAIFEEEQVRHYKQCSHRKLVNAAPQRWSGVANVLETVIVNRVAIDAVYTSKSQDSPLTIVSNEVDELHSVIKPAA